MSRPKIGDKVKVREFGRHRLEYHWPEVIRLSAYTVDLKFSEYKTIKFRWRDGYQSGYNGDRSGYQICEAK